MLEIKENKSYPEKASNNAGFDENVNNVNKVDEPYVYKMDTQIRLDKDSVDKCSIDKDNIVLKNVLDVYSKFINSNFSPSVPEELSHFIEQGLTEEVITKAIHIAVDENKKSFAYLRGILDNCLSSGGELKPKEKKEETKKAKYSSYNQREYTDEDYKRFLKGG